MRIISIAAGTGTRLLPLTKDRPKILLEICDGVTLLETQVKSIASTELFEDALYVTGYCSDMVHEALHEYSIELGLSSRILFNPFYSTTNNFVSVWLAREHFGRDTMLSNGDNLFQPNIYHALNEVPNDGIYLAVSKKNEFDDDDMKAQLSSDGTLLAVAKTLDPAICQAESLGLLLVRGDSAREEFCSCVEDLAKDQENLNRYWLTILNELIARGVTVNTVNVDGENDWQEVDFAEDLMRAAERFQSINIEDSRS